MASSLVNRDAVQDETFLPGQIFVFGHLEQIESYAPGHQVRFGNLNYTADIHRDLIFNGFEPMSGAPHSHDEEGCLFPSLKTVPLPKELWPPAKLSG